MLNNTNMGVGDGRPKYLHAQQVKLEKVIILIAFFCKVVLLCNVQTAVLQQFRLLQVARILVFDWLRVSWSHTKHRLTSPEDTTNQVCLWPVKHATYSDSVPKSRTSYYFLQQLFGDLQQSDMFQKGLIRVVKRAT